MMEWITDRRPEKEGTYLVTLEYEGGEYNGATRVFEPDGKLYREVATRYYAAPEIFEHWAMIGEDPKDYHWTEESESAMNERVVAWATGVSPYDGDCEPDIQYVFCPLGTEQQEEVEDA